MKIALTAAVLTVAAAAANAATELNLLGTVALDPALSGAAWNYHPQGLGYDESTDELLYVQQSHRGVYRTDTDGNYLGFLGESSNRNYLTSVAADDTYYYVSDYTGNTSFQDLYRINKATGVTEAIGSEVAAYGGMPLDVQGGLLYRTEASTSYSYSNLDTIRISNVGTPDIFTTVALSLTTGIGDIAVDAARNSVWTIDYSASASLRRFDLTTGAEIESFNLGLDGLTAGIAFANDRLYYYDWASGGSTLSTYEFDDGMSAVPLPAGLPLMLAGVGAFGLLRRRHAA